jgi:uncharacterized Zn-finger protein
MFILSVKTPMGKTIDNFVAYDKVLLEVNPHFAGRCPYCGGTGNVTWAISHHSISCPYCKVVSTHGG